ncbi:hypothetical protein [Sulfurimonas sp.]
MSKFYFRLWLSWVVRITLCSTFLAAVFSLFITLIIYLNEGAPSLSIEIIRALEKVALFWFMIVWNFTLLVALFRSIKYIFNRCYGGYKFQLLSCPNDGGVEVIQEIGYGDLLKVWRKWFMLLIWLVGSLMIVALSLTYLIGTNSGLFEWFNIYVLFIFIVVGGYFSFVLMANRCKKIRLLKC